MTAQAIDFSWHGIWTLIQERPGTIGGLVILALVVRWVILRLVTRAVASTAKGAQANRSVRLAQRARTIGGLARSLATWVVVAIFGIMLLDQMGINVAPLIAGAGVVGIAVGFGAQTLVKDHYSVGDRVELETPQLNTSGIVEAVSHRVTRVRDDIGKIVYIRNGEILRVSNLTQGDVVAAPDVDDPTD